MFKILVELVLYLCVMGRSTYSQDFYADPNENDVMQQRVSVQEGQEDYYDNVDSSGNMGELPEYSDDLGSESESEVIDPTLPPAYLEWCDAGERKRVVPGFCKEIVFVQPFPPCFCFEGILSIQMDETRDCERSVHFGKRSCLRFDSFGSGARSVRFVRSGSFKTNDSLAATRGRTDSKWRLTPLSANCSVLSSGQVSILNGQLFQDGKGTNCIQRSNPNDTTGSVYVYRNVFGEFSAGVHEKCSGSCISDSRFVKQISIDAQAQCTLACPVLPEIAPGGFGVGETDPRIYAIRAEVIPEPPESCQPIPASLKSLHADLNKRILQRSIEMVFKDDSNNTEFKPIRSFMLLKKMAEITGKVCQQAGIGEALLENAVGLLQVAHEGRGYYFHEDFAQSDFEQISKVLTNCLDDVWPIRFRCETCGGEVKEVYNITSYRSVTLPSDHTYYDHHIALDIPWAIVNLVNVICVDYFHHSYRMYHLLEQGMEKMYTKELRTFWLYPEYPRNLYERLFGPYWTLHVKNLELCVQGAYLTSPKRMYPLERPTWLPGSATRTKAKKVCRRRRTHEGSKTLSSTYEIYCDALQCQ